MSAAPTSLPAASDPATDAVRKHEVHFEPPVSQTPDASRSQAQQDNAEGSVGDADSLATRVKSGVFVDAVTPRRRGTEPEVVLTRELLESFYHLPLDTVAERLVLSKTTIKAACRRLGLSKWPFQHTGMRKQRRRMRVTRPEEAADSADSEHARILKATFHELMDNSDAPPSVQNVSLKRQRVGEEQLAPTVVMGEPLTTLPPGATLAGLQQSVLALSAMVTALSAADQQLALNKTFPGLAFLGIGATSAQAPTSWMPAPQLPGGNFAGSYKPEIVGGFQPWGPTSASFSASFGESSRIAEETG
ncbi:hypothetical protein T484DRAFT_1783467 [Baffinella frigidus]|nr:hypothetical protein T484DRAFT_1783467 [Cryptophyta sp. CCMP2293]